VGWKTYKLLKRMKKILKVQARIEAKVDIVLLRLTPVDAMIEVGDLVKRKKGKGKVMKKKVLQSGGGKGVAPAVDITDIQQAGAVLVALDAAGQHVNLDPAKVTVNWTTSDDTVLSVTPDASNSLVATVSSKGKLGSATVSAQITNNDGSGSPLNASVTINVTTSTPVDAMIELGTPTP
jgi:hypothetical protein